MDELNGNRTFSHTGGNSLHRSMPDIADGKYARNVGLKQKWIALQRPFLWTLARLDQIRSGKNEAAVIALDRISHPVCAWQSSDEDKHRSGWHSLYLAGIRTENRDLLQMGIAMHLGDAGVTPDLDLRSFVDLIDQVLRHCARE